MNILVDINVFMDILQAREGVRSSLRTIVFLREQDEHHGFISALTVPILYYLESQRLSDKEARGNVKKLIEGFKCVDLTADVIEAAFKEESIPDFEDCIQYHSAKVGNCQMIITRNTKDFKKIELEVYTPEEFIETVMANLGQKKAEPHRRCPNEKTPG